MIIGILGGMGPLATADLMKKLTLHTHAEKDQDHFRVIIDSHAQIPDRTAFILGKGEDPIPFMKESIDLLETAGVDLIMMPCNTAHYFHQTLSKYTSKELINMVRLTAEHVAKQHDSHKVYLLATKGTYQTQIYQQYNSSILIPEEAHQEILMKIIYLVKGNDLEEANQLMAQLTDDLDGDAFILGCTELSALASEYPDKNKLYIDPMDVMVEYVIMQKAALL